MESDRPDRDAAVPPNGAPGTGASAEPARSEWRALNRLRDRVEAAALEIERLRRQNADLARRVAEVQEGASAPPLFDPGETPAALRAKVEAFIATLDRVLAEPLADGDPTVGETPDDR